MNKLWHSARREVPTADQLIIFITIYEKIYLGYCEKQNYWLHKNTDGSKELITELVTFWQPLIVPTLDEFDKQYFDSLVGLQRRYFLCPLCNENNRCDQCFACVNCKHKRSGCEEYSNYCTKCVDAELESLKLGFKPRL